MKKLLIALCVICTTSLFAASIAELEKGCKSGNAENCNELGFAYYQGDGVKQDYAKANELFKKACDKDSMFGCSNLGGLYDNGYGVPQDYAKANELYKKACDKGHAAGCINLGLSYDQGDGVQQDHTKANELYKKACDKGHAMGCNNLGFSYERGNGVQQNNAKALELYTKSCDMGENLGCNNRVFALRKLPSDNNPSPIGLQLGKSTIAEAKQKHRLIKEEGSSAITGGEIYDIDIKNITIEGVKSGFVVFEEDGTLAYVSLTINKNRFDAMFDQLNNKHKLTYKDIPSGGNKLATFKVGNSAIALSAPHLSSELKLIYATDAFWQALTNYNRKQQEQKQQSEASRL